MKRLLSLFLAALFAFAPVAQAELRAVSPPSVLLLAQSWVAVSAPSDTTEDTLATITVPAGMLGPNGAVRLHVLFSFTNSANNKTFRVRFSGGAGTTYLTNTTTTTSGVVVDLVIANRGVTNSQVGSTILYTNGGGIQVNNGGAAPTSAVDTAAAATTVVITGQKALNTETLTLEGYIAEVIH